MIKTKTKSQFCCLTLRREEESVGDEGAIKKIGRGGAYATSSRLRQTAYGKQQEQKDQNRKQKERAVHTGAIPLGSKKSAAAPNRMQPNECKMKYGLKMQEWILLAPHSTTFLGVASP